MNQAGYVRGKHQLACAHDAQGGSRLRLPQPANSEVRLEWSDHPEERLNVRSGICLSCLHDAAFDCHLISFDQKLRLVLSPRLKQALPHSAVAESFGAYEGEPLSLPEDAVAPDPAFLAQHRAGMAR